MCTSESQILQLISDELPPPQRRQLLEHIEKCPACAQRYHQQLQLWQTLGAWNLDSPQIDLTPRVLQRAARANSLPWLKAAAAIVFSCGLGIAAALAAGHFKPAPPAAEISQADLVSALGLEVLGADGGLTHALLDCEDACDTTEAP